MRARNVGVCGVLVALAVAASCGADHPETSAEHVASPLGVTAISPSAGPQKRIDDLRERFRITKSARLDRPAHAPTSVPVIGEGIATSFEASRTEIRAVLPLQAKQGIRRTASVELPLHASAMARVEDDTTHVSVGFALRDANDAAFTAADGIALYAGALAGSDIIHRVRAEGTEDFVVFEEHPAREEIVYDVDVSRAAGLRLVANTLEFLDERGTPVLRVAPPYVVGADGGTHEAILAVDGCAYDTSSAGPWGRAVTNPGAASCGVRVAWSDAAIVYPAVVDPYWAATGSMATARSNHTAAPLSTGKVLVAGGENANNNTVLSSAELYDPTVGTFAATASMLFARYNHSATVLSSGKVLIAGGLNAGYVNIVKADLFNPAAGTFTATGSMATARSAHTATLLVSDKVLVTGGAGIGGNLGSAELYDPTGAGTFTATGALATARQLHTATLLPSGKVLVAGGYDGMSTVFSSAELFDPTGAGSFATTGSMTQTRFSHTGTLLASGQVLMVGGSGTLASSAELFDGSAVFTATGSMDTTRVGHTATLLTTGNVLVAGGDFVSGSAEVFDPITAMFVDDGSMSTLRSYHTATLLASGQVLVAGGVAISNPLASAELLTIHPAGGACTLPGDCVSGVCEDGVCCSGPCSGTCMTCTAATGACVAVMNAVDPDTCTGSMTCDANGLCKTLQGKSCKLPSDCLTGFCAGGVCCDSACDLACDTCSQFLGAPADGTCGPAQMGNLGVPPCGAGLQCDGVSPTCPPMCTSDMDCSGGKPCVDGACCDSLCTGECEACDVAGHSGTCVPVTGVPHGARPTCTAAGTTCGGTCDGKDNAACTYPSTIGCATSCADGQETDSTCDGTGKCFAGQPVACPANIVTCESATKCKTMCTADSDCVKGFECSATSCVPATGGVCVGSIIVTPDGRQTDCAPYNCESGGTCRTSCQAVDDCVAPNVCFSTNKCVPPPVAPSDSGQSGGCSVVTTSSDSPSRAPTWLLAFGLCIAVRRRRVAHA